VLDQVKQPTLVACDTMNYWIHSKRDLLLELLRHIDILMVNDSEARELSGDWNIYRAARWVLERGPKMTVIKQGEHGALLVDHDTTFKVPAYPLQEVFDPTGAGDAFAGGFMAYLAASDDVTAPNLRRAMVYGAAMGSFAVEAFGVQGLEHVTRADVRARVRAFKELVHFDMDDAPPDDRSLRRRRSTARPGRRSEAPDRSAGADDAHAARARGDRAFGGMVRVPSGYERPVLVLSTDGVGTKVLVAARAGIHDTVGEDLVNHCVNDILVHGARPLAFLDYLATSQVEPESAAAIVSGVARGCRAHDMILAGGETAQLPDLYQPGQYDLAGTIVGIVEESAALHGTWCGPATC